MRLFFPSADIEGPKQANHLSSYHHQQLQVCFEARCGQVALPSEVFNGVALGNRICAAEGNSLCFLFPNSHHQISGEVKNGLRFISFGMHWSKAR